MLSVLVAVLVCTAVDLWGAWFSAGESFGMSAMVAIAFMVALWILKRSRFWKRIADHQIAVWQFSVAQILIAMTVCALLITALRRSELVQDVELWKFLVAHTMCDVAVVLITTVLWAKLQPWPIRLAAVLAGALIAGALLTTVEATGIAGAYVGDSFKDLVPNTAYTILISLIVLIWLELAPIVPIRRRTMSISSAGDLE